MFLERLFNAVGAKSLQEVGNVQTINSQSIRVHTLDESGNVLSASGTVTVTDGGSGYAVGCTYRDTNVGAGVEGFYVNIGTTSACQFELLGQVDTADITDGAVTNVKLGVPKLVTYQETFAFGDMTDGGATTGTFDLSVSIPEGAIVVQSFIDAVTGFAGDTSATYQLGDGTDVDRYSTGTPDVFSDADHVSAGAVSGTAYHAAAKTPKVTITTAADFTSVSAGELTATLMYYQSV